LVESAALPNGVGWPGWMVGASVREPLAGLAADAVVPAAGAVPREGAVGVEGVAAADVVLGMEWAVAADAVAGSVGLAGLPVATGVD
jgi:hypothetical protein